MKKLPWVIFDADNTLWTIEHLYDEARHLLCEFVVEFGANRDDVENFQRSKDGELYDKLGYSAERFPLSFRETLKHFAPECSKADLTMVHQFAMSVFEREARLEDDVESVINSLKPRFQLGILTAGEAWVQKNRIRLFPYSDEFDAIDIVDEKNCNAFRRFCDAHNVRTERSWVVGDSIKSDVLPAIEVGLSAIHYDTHNWKLVEQDGINLPRGIKRVESLGGVIEIILDS